jgi:hypothetical protein
MLNAPQVNPITVQINILYLFIYFGDWKCFKFILQNVDQIHRITIALSILEKYTKHLLKPEENRSNMWKYVKFSNQIFKDRVDAIQVHLFVFFIL